MRRSAATAIALLTLSSPATTRWRSLVRPTLVDNRRIALKRTTFDWRTLVESLPIGTAASIKNE